MLNNTKNKRAALGLTVAMAAFFSASDALACASCGCTLSTDWGSQGVSTAEGWSYDLSDNYINQNTLIYGNSKPSAAFDRCTPMALKSRLQRLPKPLQMRLITTATLGVSACKSHF